MLNANLKILLSIGDFADTVTDCNWCSRLPQRRAPGMRVEFFWRCASLTLQPEVCMQNADSRSRGTVLRTTGIQSKMPPCTLFSY